MPAGSRVTFEPGGQIELSTPPARRAWSEARRGAAARTSMRLRAPARRRLRRGGARAPTRRGPCGGSTRTRRYLAMERHFDALGCAGSGTRDDDGHRRAPGQPRRRAGGRVGRRGWRWSARWCRCWSRVSASSPWLGGRTSGWHSMRQGTWQGIDHRRSDPVPGGDPTRAWAIYALEAPVMLVRAPDEDAAYVAGDRADPVRPVAARRRRRSGVRRRLADLDYHLTTLFPPVRPRGYVELRCLDALPDRWWPAIAAITATLSTTRSRPTRPPTCARRWPTLGDRRAPRSRTTRPSGAAVTGLRRGGRCATARPSCRPRSRRYAALLDAGPAPARSCAPRSRPIGPLGVLEEEARG